MDYLTLRRGKSPTKHGRRSKGHEGGCQDPSQTAQDASISSAMDSETNIREVDQVSQPEVFVRHGLWRRERPGTKTSSRDHVHRESRSKSSTGPEKIRSSSHHRRSSNTSASSSCFGRKKDPSTRSPRQDTSSSQIAARATSRQLLGVKGEDVHQPTNISSPQVQSSATAPSPGAVQHYYERSSSASQQYHARDRAPDTCSGMASPGAVQQRQARETAEHAKLARFAVPAPPLATKDDSSNAPMSRWAAEERKIAAFNQAPSGTSGNQATRRSSGNHSKNAPTSRWAAEERKLAAMNQASTCSPHPSSSTKDTESKPSSNTPMVEIFPGCIVPLRGSQETRLAVQRDLIAPAMCFTCDSELFCIQDAEYVLCPKCKAINPLTTTEPDTQGTWVGGLGLGITMDMLYSLQQEIMAEYQMFGRR